MAQASQKAGIPLDASTSCIFLCYRREDTQDAADRLHERLVQTYGSDRVFMDVDNVPLGVNFVSYIAKQLQECGAVLVMIGRQWIKIADEEGRRRLDDPADHVRVEIATALRLRVPVRVANMSNGSSRTAGST